MTDTLQIAMNFWQALRSRDADIIRAAVTADVEWIAPPRNATAVALGVTDHMVGPDEIIRFIVDDFRRMFSTGMKVDIISITANADRVVFEQQQSAVLTNGRRFELPYIFILETADGRVSQVREYMYTLTGYQLVFGNDEPGKIF